jgi:hypothetical protein
MGKHYIQIIPIITKLKELLKKIYSVATGQIAYGETIHCLKRRDKSSTHTSANQDINKVYINTDLVCCKILDCTVVRHHMGNVTKHPLTTETNRLAEFVQYHQIIS